MLNVKVLAAKANIGDAVKNIEGEILGEIVDILFNPNSLDVEYGVVNYKEDGKLFAIPFSMLDFCGEEGYFLLPVSKALMQETNSFITYQGNMYYSLH